MKTQKRKYLWHPAPKRGCINPHAELHRFTVVRLKDRAERVTDTLPGVRIRKSPDFMVWDNRLNSEWID